MLGVTSHITNNIGSAPFLWIMPLAIYLLTFIIVFAKNPIVTSKNLHFVTPLAVIGALWFSFIAETSVLISIIMTLICYFLIALASHMKLVDKRPSVQNLTNLNSTLIILIPSIAASILAFTVLTAVKIPNNQALFFSGLITAFGVATLNKNFKISLVLNFILVWILAIVTPYMVRKDVLTDRSFFGILHVIRSHFKNRGLKVAMVGLGAGAMACYEAVGDDWTYFEIDPAVVKMAMNPNYFSYMDKCSLESDVRIGDARLKLVTREALALYQSRLKDDGLIFFHTSNRVLDVSSVVANLALDAGLDTRFIEFKSFAGHDYEAYLAPSSALLIGSTKQMQEATRFDSDWKKLIPSPDVGIWTDDYSHIAGTLMAHYKKNKQVIEASDN